MLEFSLPPHEFQTCDNLSPLIKFNVKRCYDVLTKNLEYSYLKPGFSKIDNRYGIPMLSVSLYRKNSFENLRIFGFGCSLGTFKKFQKSDLTILDKMTKI